VLSAPILHVEGRIGEDVVRLEVGETVVQEGVALLNAAVDPADGQVHLGEPPSGVVELLAVDADITDPPAVGTDELLGLYKHAGGAAARVVDPPSVGSEHLHQELDDAARRVELTALLSLGARELSEEVLVHPAEDVPGVVVGSA